MALCFGRDPLLTFLRMKHQPSLLLDNFIILDSGDISRGLCLGRFIGVPTTPFGRRSIFNWIIPQKRIRDSIQSYVREHISPQYCNAAGTTHAIDTACVRAS